MKHRQNQSPTLRRELTLTVLKKPGNDASIVSGSTNGPKGL